MLVRGRIVITSDQVLEQFGDKLASVGEEIADRIFARALNDGGKQGYTAVKKMLVKQTSIKYGKINKAVTVEKAHPNKLSYTILGHGTETNLGFFDAKQRKKGVSARAWGKRHIYKRSFMLPSGKVYLRIGKERGPLGALWGPHIAREIVKDPTAGAWERTTPPAVMRRIEHELTQFFARRAAGLSGLHGVKPGTSKRSEYRRRKAAEREARLQSMLKGS